MRLKKERTQVLAHLIDILDCEEHSPYYKSKIVFAKRLKSGSYAVQTDMLDFAIVTNKRHVKGDIFIYKMVKKVVDGVCRNHFEE